MELKEVMNKSTNIVIKVKTRLSVLDETNRNKTSKDIKYVKNTICLLHVIDIYRTLHLTIADHMCECVYNIYKS